MFKDRVYEFLKDEIFTCNDCECVVLSDAEECYSLGYQDAVEKASQYVYHLCAHPNVNIDCEELEKHFKKYMLLNPNCQETAKI